MGRVSERPGWGHDEVNNRNRKRGGTLRKSSWRLRTRAFGSYLMYEHLKCRGSKLNQDGGSVVELQR